MNYSQDAVDFIQESELPFWKIYYKNSRVAVCDVAENPGADSATAVYEFEQALKRLTANGAYYVNAYEKPKGDKGGRRFDFRIETYEPKPQPHHPNTNRSFPMDYESIKRQIEDQILIKQSLERIEKKMDVLLNVIELAVDDNKDNDNEIMPLIKSVLVPYLTKAAPAGAKTFVPTSTGGSF